MQKTKLVLAFGAHGLTNKDGKRESGPTQWFFKKAILPEISKTFFKKGKATVILEALFWDDAGRPGTEDLEAYRRGDLARVEGKLKDGERRLNEINQVITNALSARLDTGKTKGDVNDWGFEKWIVRLNRLRPKTITTLPESPVVEAMWQRDLANLLREKLRNATPSESIDLMMERINAHSKAHHLRDRAVFELAQKLREENPSRMIIIPRGEGHRGMQVLFPESEYEARVSCAFGYFDFETEATIRSYESKLGTQELSDYAKLQIDYTRHYLERTLSPLHNLLFIGGDKLNYRLFHILNVILVLESRRFAIEKNPGCAERLGIRL